MDNREQSEAFIKMLTNSIDYAMKEFDLTNAQIIGAIEISKQLYLNQLLWGAATVDDLPEDEVEYEYEEEEEDDEGEDWKA